ncbi:MAG: helix-turn-helix domain-containing protein [bacterium]
MANHAGDMVKAALRSKGMTQLELAERIGKDQTLISRLISGQPVSDATARSIAEALNIDLDEFLLQLQRDRLERKRKSLIKQFKEVISEDEKKDVLTSEKESIVVGHVGVEEQLNVSFVPLAESIPFSDKRWREKASNFVIPSSINIDKDKAFALKVSGEDMTDDKIDEGDIIVVDPSAKTQDGDRVLVLLGDKVKLKRIYQRGDAIILQAPENSKEPVIFLSPKDDFTILGKLVLCTKYLAE